MRQSGLSVLRLNVLFSVVVGAAVVAGGLASARAAGDLEECTTADFKTPESESIRFCQKGGYLFGRGTIRQGTSDALTRAIVGAGDIDRVFLQSGGGVVAEGIKMGRIIRAAGLDTAVTGYCASACVLAFLGGKNRFKDGRARLGDHQSLAVGNLSPERALQHRRVVEAAIRAHWKAMGADPAALKVAWKTSHFSVHWFGKDELRKWKIVTAFSVASPKPARQRRVPPKSTAYGFALSCGNMKVFAKAWNKTNAKKWVNKRTRLLPITIDCGAKRLNVRIFVKARRSQIPKSIQLKSARRYFCKDAFLREQMGFGWRVFQRLDFSGRRSRTIAVRCNGKPKLKTVSTSTKARAKAARSGAGVSKAGGTGRAKASRVRKPVPRPARTSRFDRRRDQPISDVGTDLYR